MYQWETVYTNAPHHVVHVQVGHIRELKTQDIAPSAQPEEKAMAPLDRPVYLRVLIVMQAKEVPQVLQRVVRVQQERNLQRAKIVNNARLVQ